MSLQQNTNNSIFSLSQLKNMKKQNDCINMSEKEFNKEMNWQVNSDEKVQDEIFQYSEEAAIKPKEAREKAIDAIINKQAEYILSQDNNSMINRMDPNM